MTRRDNADLHEDDDDEEVLIEGDVVDDLEGEGRQGHNVMQFLTPWRVIMCIVAYAVREAA